MKTGFLFLLQTIYELASCVQIPRAIGAFYYVWKWHNVQQARSEMRRCTTHALYWFKLWQQDHCQLPQNANPYSSTLEGTAQHIRRPFGEVVERKDTARKIQTKEFIEKIQAIIDETPQQPIQQTARDLGISHTTVNACAKEDLKCRSYRRQTSQILTEKTKNLRLIKSILPRPEPAGLLCLVKRREHHQHDLPQHQSQPDRCHLLSSCQHLWKRHAHSSGSVLRRWLRLKVVTLNRCSSTT